MPFLTRPFYCEGKHKRATRYIVWGGTSQSLITYKLTRPIIDNITPHLVSYLTNKKGIVEIAITCGIEGCGFHFDGTEEDPYQIVIDDVKSFSFTKKEFESLRTFQDTGYELCKFKRT